MASKVSKHSAVTINGVLSIENGKVFVEVEDFNKPFDLAIFLENFDGLDVNLSVTHKEDVGGEDS